MYGLNTHFIEDILNKYFGNEYPSKDKKDIRIGLGLALQGATQNLYDFDEVSTDSKNTLGYSRAKVAFSSADNGMMFNTTSVMFSTAVEDWTLPERKIQSVGIFNTKDYYKDGELVKPLIILELPSQVEVKAGETVVFDPSTIVLNLSDD